MSVIIPAYGRGEALLAAVDSVVPAQHWSAEIVVVDDCSPVPLQVPARNRYGVPVRLYRQSKNGGAQAARNLGIRRAGFDYIAFLDSDDRFLANKLERVRQVLAETSCDILIHDARNMEQYARVNQHLFSGGRPKAPFWLIVAMLNPVATPALVVRRGGGLGPPSLRFCEDWAFLIRRAVPGIQVRYLPETLSHINRDDGMDRLSSAFWKMRKGELKAKSMHWRQPLLIALASTALSLTVWTVRVLSDIARGRYAPFGLARRAAARGRTP